jgi:hypothetical protein
MTVGIDWPGVWYALATALRVHVEAGRRHLLTEDVVRFATVTVLADHGVTADRLAAERTVAGVGRVDLLVDHPGVRRSSSSSRANRLSSTLLTPWHSESS